MFSILSDGKMIEFDRYDHTYCRAPRNDDDGSSLKKKPTTITVEIQSGAQTIHTVPPVLPTPPTTTLDVVPPRDPVIIVKKKKNRRQQLVAEASAANSVKPKLTLPVLDNPSASILPTHEEAPSTVVIVSPAPEVTSISNYDNVGAEVAVNGGSSPEVKPEILKVNRPVKRKPKPVTPNMLAGAIGDQEPPAKSPRKVDLVTIPRPPKDIGEPVVIPVDLPKQQSNGIQGNNNIDKPVPVAEKDDVKKVKPVTEIKTPKIQNPPPVVVTSSGRTRKTPSKFLEPPEEIKTPRQKSNSKKGKKNATSKAKSKQKQLKNPTKVHSATKTAKLAKSLTTPDTASSNTPAPVSNDTEESQPPEKTSTQPQKPASKSVANLPKSTKPVKSNTQPAKPAGKKSAPVKATTLKSKSKVKKQAMKVVVPQSNRGKAKEIGKKQMNKSKSKADKSIPAAKIDLTNIIASSRRRR